MTNAYNMIEENKIEKSLRNSKAFNTALVRATKGDFDEDLTSATNMDLLKVTEKWVIREIFCIEKGHTYFKLYKEVYYVENPHKYYFDEVEPTVYRRIAGQKETGDLKWAKAISNEYKCDIVYRVAKKPATKKTIDVTKAKAKSNKKH